MAENGKCLKVVGKVFLMIKNGPGDRDMASGYSHGGTMWPIIEVAQLGPTRN